MASRRLMKQLQNIHESGDSACDEGEGSCPDTTANQEGKCDAQQPSTEPSPEEDRTEQGQGEKSAKRRRGGGRRGKKKKHAVTHQEEEQDAEEGHEEGGKGVGEVERALSELGLNQREAGTEEERMPISDEHGPEMHSLQVDVKALKPEEELRRIFGARLIRQEMKRSQGTTRRHHKSIFVMPKENWPPYHPLLSNGLAMSLVESRPNGVQVFRFVPSDGYANARAAFDECVATNDPNALGLLVQERPYHADGLMALADVLQRSGEGQRASDMLERALHAFELASHPLFSQALAKGKARMDGEEELNARFFEALARQASCLCRRGCARTALELSKCLLQLDITDPAGSLVACDHYALRSGCPGWLAQFADELNGMENSRWASFLPGMAVNVPLARMEAEGEGAEQGGNSRLHALAESLIIHSALVPSLLRRWNGKAGVRSDWTELAEDRLFANADCGGSASREYLTHITVERNHELWLQGNAQGKLVEAAKLAVACAKSDVPVREGGNAPSELQKACMEVFPPSSENEYSHLDVSDFSDELVAEHHFGEGGGGGDEMEFGAAEEEHEVREAQSIRGFLGRLFDWLRSASHRAEDDETAPPGAGDDDEQ